LRFDAAHELWANYAYTQVDDDGAPAGQIRNFTRHEANLGGQLVILDDRIELGAQMTIKSSMLDPHRPAVFDPARPDYSLSCEAILGGALPANHSLYRACQFPTLSDGIWVFPGWSVDEEIQPLVLLDVGVRFKNIWRDLTIAFWFHNILDHRYFEPDAFSDPRVISRPQPKPGMSFFGQISLGL
jgi:hypothetical protein